MLEEFLYCTYLRRASEQRLLAELAAWQRMCAEQSCKPQAKLDKWTLCSSKTERMVCAALLFCIGVVATLCIFNRLPSYARSPNTLSACMARERTVCFTLGFLTEMISKMLVEGFLPYIRDQWHWLDCGLVFFDLVQTVMWIANIDRASDAFALARVVRVARLSRISHVLRVSFSQNLVRMTSSISGKVIARYAPELLK
eukprot:symbB.v1.2.032637.t1/scaffold3945.1/size47733/1